MITGQYRAKFGGDTADDVLQKLKTYTDENAIIDLISRIGYVSNEKHVSMLALTVQNLKTWIIDVIQKNQLKAILFIWDEFSEFFENNRKRLTGFQDIIELSTDYPFYMVIVTHKSEAFFNEDNDQDKKKLFDRFVQPFCSIELPENMAFTLMGHAMRKNTSDPVISKEWNEQIVGELYNLTNDSRKAVEERAGIGEKELKGIVPIHPYAALVLKNISSAYESNQRSMFDFIKNDRGDEIKGFQWFINNYGPLDDHPLLTVDMLWDFFYEKGKEQLAPKVRNILDCYARSESHHLNLGQKAVLRTLLLLQAISENVADSVELFIPSERNLRYAMEGTDFEENCVNIAESLVKESILFKRPMGGGKEKYSALISSANQEEVNKYKEELKLINTSKLAEEAEMSTEFKLPKCIEIRYVSQYVGLDNLKQIVNQARNARPNHPTKLVSIFVYAKNENEEDKISENIREYLNDPELYNVIFVDCSSCPLSGDLFSQYIDAAANAKYQLGKDNAQARQYSQNAKDILKKWVNALRVSEWRIFDSNKKEGYQCNSFEETCGCLRDIDKQRFSCSPETNFEVIDNLYGQNALRAGALCGITEECKGTFKSINNNTKLETNLNGAWHVENYWDKTPSLVISKIKKRVEEIMSKAFESRSRISIAEIYDSLKDSPFGFMPCNLSSFLLGFLLKEYANDSYNWSDDLNSEPMNHDKLAGMIDALLKNDQTPNPKYRESFIVKMSDEQRMFNHGTSIAFGISESLCTSVENTRNHIRNVMINLKFPIWTLKYNLDDLDIKSQKETMRTLLDDYAKIANNAKGEKTETDIALEIGKLFKENIGLIEDLKSILSGNNCIEGMKKYLAEFEGGRLIQLAEAVGDKGNYISVLRGKFDAEASNWVWSKDTVDAKIRETILEYEIISESNKVLTKSTTYGDAISAWRERCKNIKVAYLSCRNEVGDLGEFLEQLYRICKNGSIYDADKAVFLKLLKEKSDEFQNFYNNQLEVLKKVGTFYFTDLSDEDVSYIARGLYDVFTKENSEFLNLLDEKVKTYKSNLGKYKLQQAWKAKTNSSSPMEWSAMYSMPILAMITGKEENAAREAFTTIGENLNDDTKVRDAINFVETSTSLNALGSRLERDKAFNERILGNYSTILKDINKVKDVLKEKLPTIHPYNWLGSSEVMGVIQSLAQHEYINGGSSEASSVIDSMSSEEAKEYLKRLIKENMNVGIEIIKTKK